MKYSNTVKFVKYGTFITYCLKVWEWKEENATTINPNIYFFYINYTFYTLFPFIFNLFVVCAIYILLYLCTINTHYCYYKIHNQGRLLFQ